MKIYTKTGDDGTTSLIGGKRVSKCDPHLEVYGTLDELSSFIGLLKAESDDSVINDDLEHIQEILTRINCCFACPDEETSGKFKFDKTLVAWIEGRIDEYSSTLPPVEKFLIPGTSRQNALSNICRTICRRAERNAYSIDLLENQRACLIFINRLSDFFFVIGRIL